MKTNASARKKKIFLFVLGLPSQLSHVIMRKREGSGVENVVNVANTSTDANVSK